MYLDMACLDHLSDEAPFQIANYLAPIIPPGLRLPSLSNLLTGDSKNYNTDSTPTDINANCQFLRKLPAEIRNLIYEELLFNPVLGKVESITKADKLGRTANYGLSPAILTTCREINKEAAISSMSEIRSSYHVYALNSDTIVVFTRLHPWRDIIADWEHLFSRIKSPQMESHR